MFFKYPIILTLFTSLLTFGNISAVSAANSITTLGNITRITSDDRTLEVEDGYVYQLGQTRNNIGQLYDPNFIKNNYVEQNNKIYRVVPGYGYLEVQRSLSENFDPANSIRDLIGPNSNWTSMTIQGKATPTVEDYVRLRNEILTGNSDFIDNRLDPSTQRKHSGAKSLRASVKYTSYGLDLNKSSLDSELVAFARGDDFYFSGWFYLEKGKPTSILDLESSYMVESPGIRLMLDEQLRPSVELKFAHKPTFRMAPQAEYSLPTGKWVQIRMHIYLMDSDAGGVRLWIDNDMVIEQAGRTLTLFDAVYNSLQVGITSAPAAMDTVLYVDDVEISNSSF